MPYKPDYDLIRFGDKNDKLNRKEGAILITDYLLTQTDSKVIAINSAWGTGKTWFVHMWKNELRKNPEYQEKVIPIYYNAWENDDYGDAFIPLLAAINEYLPEDGNKKEAYLDAAKELFVSMISGPLKKMTFDMVDGKEIKEIYDKYKESLGSDFELAINDFQKQKELKENFSNALKEFTLIDKEQNKNDEEKTKKIFIFIDELDRCRPTFAIETLERIKHYFGIEKLHFILMQDNEQLSHSVKVLYGNDCDTGGYLKRFVDISLNLSNAFVKDFLYLNFSKEFAKPLNDLKNIFSLSLRDYEKFQVWYNFYKNHGKIKGYNNRYSIYLLIYFYFLKDKKFEQYNEIIRNDNLKDDLNWDMLPYVNEINTLSNYKPHNKGVFNYLFDVMNESETYIDNKYNNLGIFPDEDKILINSIPKTLKIFDTFI